MPRIFKGTETLLKLFVPRVDEGNLETLKIGLFTDDTNNAAEFYGDNMSIDGDTVYLKVNAWSFDMMNDGVLNYIAEIEIGEETIITERQSNYFLKTPNQYVPVGPNVDLSDYYTKPEIDEMLEDIEVDVDLTGYATEQYVNDAIANIDIPEGGGSTIVELSGTKPTLEEFNLLYESASAGKPTYVKYNDGMFSIIADYDSITNRGLYHLYNSAFDVFMVFWYNKSNDSTVYSIKKQIFCSYGVSELVMSSKNDMKLYISNASINELPQYYEDYSKQFKAPLSINRDKTISMILDGKLYFWDFTDESTNVGNGYHYPKVVDLVNISGGSGDLSDYYTKPEIDEMLEDIEVDVDLTGYATEQWVRQQGYVTDSDVNDYVGNEIGQLEEIINTKQDELISGTNIKTINGNDILGEGDITIEGGGDLSNYYTKTEIDTMIGDINNILETI